MKKILFFLLVLASFTLSAQNEQVREMMRTMTHTRIAPGVSAENIQFWVGEGDNEVIATFFLCANTPVGIVYGYRFNGSATIHDMFIALNAADPNLTMSLSSSGMINELEYDNDTIYAQTDERVMYSLNEDWNDMPFPSEELSDGDYFELWQFDDCDLPTTNIYYPVPQTTPILPDDATIAAADVLYWVGEGSSDVIFIINWCNPGNALAWGVHFNGDSILVADILDTILAYDDRFDYDIDNGWVNDLIFVNENDSLSLQGSYFMYNVNGENASGINLQYVQNGDYIKFGDEMCGFHDESWVFVWNTPIVPVPVPQTTPELPDDATISADDVLYWVGEGSSDVIFIINWCNPGNALAWGVHFNGDSILVADILDTILAYDDRFDYDIDNGWVNDLIFVNENDSLSLQGSYFMYNVNGENASGINLQYVQNGDYIKFGDEMCGFHDESWVFVWNTPIVPVPVPQTTPELPDDATISADNVMYWVGNGENEVVFVVNFCNPEAEALAWGVRFSGESAIVSDIFHTIELYDERFAVEGTSFVSNITFADGIHDNYSTSMYWMYNVNGVTASNYADQQEVHHGDVIKFGDAACGIITDSVMYTYVWTTPIVPVELPSLSTEVFDGIVGTEGCKAIKYDDPAILGWATSCVVTRGYQNIANGEGSAVASFGTDADGVGPASLVSDDGVVSLGDAGTAVLTFGMPITNGEGYDFAVFENALNHTFLELAFVEVSSDGEHFYRFPSVSNTQTSTQIANGGAVDATKLYNLAGKYIIGYGTPFDLEELAGYSNLDINNVTHVRIVDVVGSINPLYGTTDKNGHLINDPYPTPFYSSGFDLSGVAVMNGWTPATVNNYQQQNSFVAYPNPCQNVLNVSNATVNEPVSLFNTTGQQIWSGMTQDTYFQLDMQSYPAGVYMLQIGSQMTKIVKR